MRPFTHTDAHTIAEAGALLAEGNGSAAAIAGGTDLLGALKDDIYLTPPEHLVNLKTIPGLTGIEHDTTGLRIGALTRLHALATHPVVRQSYSVLAEAARAVASPQIRRMGTVGGNLCQAPRCWYYRGPENIFHCTRKAGRLCNALTGENRYHSIFGAVRVAATPCTENCPTHVDIAEYMAMIRAGDLDDAARKLLETNPLPAITGRVCPHFCEQACNRGVHDAAVSVRSVERFLGDHILANPALVAPPATENGSPLSVPGDGKRVAIVGAGPAGLSAAHYLSLSGHRVVIFDRMPEPGGMLRYAIPAYRLPSEVVARTARALADRGVEFRQGVTLGQDVTLSGLRADFDAVLLAVGAWGRPSIGLDGEALTQSGLELLVNVRRGVPAAIGRRVVVIGGGSVATDVAITARRLGAEQVTLVCLECREEMPAFEEEIDQSLDEGVTLLPSWGPARVLATNGEVTGLEIVRCTSVFDENDRFAPAFDHCVTATLVADQVFLAVGQRTDLAFLGQPSPAKSRCGVGVHLNGSVIAVAEDTQATDQPGVFAGGDVTSGRGTVVDAIAQGRRAASAIDRYLCSREAPQSVADSNTNRTLIAFNNRYLGPVARVDMPSLAVPRRSLDGEDALGIDAVGVATEANRCFNCGCVAVSPSDLAPALIVLDARIITTRRTLPAEEFFAVGPLASTVLEPGELVTEIRVPPPRPDSQQAFLKFRLRNAIDFPIVGVAVVISRPPGTDRGLPQNGRVVGARIALSAVAPIPLRVTSAEEYLIGKQITEQVAADAAALAVEDALPLPKNAYKVQVTQALVRRAILAAA